MTKTTRDNRTVKALQDELSYLKNSPCNDYDGIQAERQLIGAASNRGENLTCEQVRDYCNKYLPIIGKGATKIAYGTRHLAICFIRDDHSDFFGNQISLQVKVWKRVALTPEAQYFNPVISYGLHRGNKLSTTDERYLNKSFIVSQRAEFYDTIPEAIRQAFIKNCQQYTPDMITAYYDAMKAAADKYNIGDLHCDNAGVIFDYSRRKYRAVITDYGLSK